MGIITDLIGKVKGNTDGFTQLPWNQGDSLYQWIKQRVDEQTGALPEGIGDLPDDEPDESGVRFAAGAMDGMMSHHSRHQGDQKTISEFVSLIKKVAKQNHDKALVALYHRCVEEDIQAIIDPVIEALAQDNVPVEPHLVKRMGLLLRRSPHRNPVKLAMALLGATGHSQHLPEVKVLGLHDEFTMYAAYAIGGMATDPDREWWDLAKKVDGWGRIHLVERLSATQHVGIKDWIFHEGFRNAIMNEYLVHEAANTGGLHERLSKGFVERKTLEAAADIISGLIHGGPVGDISYYDQGVAVMNAFLRHAKQHMEEPSAAVFMAVTAIRDYLSEGPAEADAQLQQLNEQSLAQADALRSDARWKKWIKQNISTGDDVLFDQLNLMAARLGMETWNINIKKLRSEPDKPIHWQQAAKRVNDERVAVFIQLAKSLIPLKSIATGASDDLGLGQEYKWHDALDVVLGVLKQHPPKGWLLIRVGLLSPVIRNRNLAMNALEAWPTECLTEEVKKFVAKAVKQETDEDIKNRMLELIHG